MPHLPPLGLVNGAVTLPEATSKSCWLNGSAVQLPDFDDTDAFVSKLARDGPLVRDPVVATILRGRPVDLSLRTAQRRFLRATGLTYKAVEQIQRAREALTLLEAAVPIADTVFGTGYADQPHLTRSLKRLVGQTPAQIRRQIRS